MAVSFINSAESIRTGTDDPYEFTFTPSSTARGIVVFVVHGVSATPLVSSITYGTKSMRLIGFAQDTATEPGCVQVWFLGEDVPSGAQTVSADLTAASTTDVAFTVIALDGATDLDVTEFRFLQEDQSNPTVTLQPYGRTKISLAGMYGGGAAPGGTLATGNTLAQTHDFGSFYSQVCYETTPDDEAHTVGWSSLQSDDLAFVAIAVAETTGYPGYVPLLGGTDSIRTNDQANLDLTGDHEVIMCLSMDDWSPSAIQCLYSKWQADSASGMAYAFRIHSAGSGITNPAWWDTGTNGMRELFGSAFPRGGGEHLWLKHEFDANTGSGVASDIYYSAAPIDADPSEIDWILFDHLTEATAAAISSNNQPLWLGLRSFNNDPMLGRYFYFELKNAIAGTTVAVMDARETDPTGSDGLGNSWSLNSTAWVEPEVPPETVVEVAGAVAATVALPQASVAAAATVSASVVGTTVAVPSAGVVVPATPAASVIPVAVGVPTPQVGAGVAVSASVVAVPISLPQAAVSAGAVVSASAVAVAVGVPAATGVVSEHQVAHPNTFALVAAIPAPTINYGSTVTPAVIAVVTSFPAPTVRAGVLEILAEQLGQFQRLSGRLHLARVRRGLRRGFRIDEGWDRVSDVFVFDEDDTSKGSFDQAMAAVAQAWADHQNDDEATLRAAVNAALDAFGFRAPDGSRLIS
ncbi:MAG TPA: hypothetical protein VF377_06915 [Acidimicrobiia bacterium]